MTDDTTHAQVKTAPSQPNPAVLYYDSRSVSRIYEMSFSGSVWKIWRQAPGFWQRYEGKVSNDGKTITAHWEKSSDGTRWEHDFGVMYTKLGNAREVCLCTERKWMGHT
jgi:hypothetical protein